jgi:hypothetical protein
MLRTHQPRWTVLLGALVVVLLATACAQADAGVPTANGDTSPAPPDTTNTPPPSDPADAALAYAQCIRENGYPEWPDPDPEGRFVMRRDHGMSFNDPRRQAAMEACQDLRPPGHGGGMAIGPGGGAAAMDEETMLEFARCIRSNGVPEFPDPGAAGGGAVIIGPESGINHNDPTFQAAAQHCVTTVLGGEDQ